MADAFMQTVAVPIWLILVFCMLMLAGSVLMRMQLGILRQLFDGYRADRDKLEHPCYDASCVLPMLHAGECKHDWELPAGWTPPHPEKRADAGATP